MEPILCSKIISTLPNQLKNFVNSIFHQKFDHFVCFDLIWAESAVSPAEKKWHFGFVVAKMSNF